MWITLFAMMLGISYLLLIVYFLYHWSKIPLWTTSADFQASTTVSVIIPARNEAANIEAVVRAILAQNYPAALLEIIVIDDHSEDATAAIVLGIADPRLRLIQLADHPLPQGQAFKKHGIQTGIRQSRGELICCTDADCVMGPDWLRSIVACYAQGGVQMIAAPVNFHREQNLLERFQSLDFLGMMVLTGAGLHSGLMRMGNGANLAYSREAFEAVGGFRGVDHLASGDDLFLMHKIEQHFPGQVKFLKSREATVYTLAMPDWRSFWQQRLRWGTKNAAYQEWRITAVLGLVFVTCWAVILGALGSIFSKSLFIPLGVVMLFKIGADYLLLQKAAAFFGRKDLLWVFWPAQVLHILYIAGVGLWANLYKKYQWKGRRVS